MATTTFAVRQFFTIPSDLGTFTAPSGTFVVTGSVSRLLVNNNRTNLANDSMSITTQFSSPYAASSGTSQGWWPGPSTVDDIGSYGIIVGGRGNGYSNPSDFANTAADNRVGGSYVSCWGWITQATQGENETAFIALAKAVIGAGALITNLATAKAALRDAGYYYQFPSGFDGQSPNTGVGSDV